MSSHIPVGAVVARVWFMVTRDDGTSTGEEFPVEEQACAHARAVKDQGWRDNLPVNRVYVNEWWRMQYGATATGRPVRREVPVGGHEYAPRERRPRRTTTS